MTEPATQGDLLDVQGLCVECTRSKRGLLSDVSIRVGPGEIVAVVGESGSGKTLAAFSILGLLPSNLNVVTGAVWWREKSNSRAIDLLGLSEAEFSTIRGHGIAMVFQEPLTALNPVFSVGEQIAESVRLYRKSSRSAAREEALSWLERVGIPEPRIRYRQYPHQLSGGMRQRVLIAMALAGEPRLLIADEPTTALDPTVQLQILDLFRSLQEETSRAILFITHDMGVVRRLAKRVYVFHAGLIVESGPIDEVLNRPKHPYTASLLESVPRVHGPRRPIWASEVPRHPHATSEMQP